MKEETEWGGRERERERLWNRMEGQKLRKRKIERGIDVRLYWV